MHRKKLTRKKRARPRKIKGNIITILTNPGVRGVPQVSKSKLISHNIRDRNTNKKLPNMQCGTVG